MKSTRQNKSITQLHKANLVLKALAVNVTANDRKAAIQDLGLSRFTIGDGLKGEAKDLDTATAMVRFFRNRIQERERELSH